MHKWNFLIFQLGLSGCFPLGSSLLVPLIARFGEKIRNYFVVIIASITAFLAFTLIPTVSSSSSGYLNLVAPWIPSWLKRRRLHRFSQCPVHLLNRLFRAHHSHLLFRVHERRKWFNTLLLLPASLHRLNDWPRDLGQFPSNVHFLGDGGSLLLLANFLLEHSTRIHSFGQQSLPHDPHRRH